jgi:hypothetical protein
MTTLGGARLKAIAREISKLAAEVRDIGEGVRIDSVNGAFARQNTLAVAAKLRDAAVDARGIQIPRRKA